MLDLSQFAKPYQTVVPILDNSFILNHKPYRVKSDSGWFLVEIKNNKASIIESSTPESNKFMRGYTHNNTIVFQNFDVAKRKWNLGLTAPLHFNQSQSFEAINVVVWEDKKVYYAGPNYSDLNTFELKDLLEADKPLADQKGITPELRTLYLFHALEREQQRKLAEEAKRIADHARMMREIPYRLNVTFQRAGAELLNFSMTGNRIIVDWKIPDSDTRYNSVLDSRTFMVVEAGYCMSNDDKRHNITSLVKTAEDYEDRELTYITRHK
jgi:hypothetical protein